jgi:hypothetical protein
MIFVFFLWKKRLLLSYAVVAGSLFNFFLFINWVFNACFVCLQLEGNNVDKVLSFLESKMINSVKLRGANLFGGGYLIFMVLILQ